MVDYFIGNSAGNGDANAGDGIILVSAFLDDYFDLGQFGFAPPDNARIKLDAVLTGEFLVTKAGFTNEVVAGSAVEGNFSLAVKVTTPDENVVQSTAFVVGVTGLTIFFDQSTLVVAPAVLGDLVLDTFQDLERDFFANLNGQRPIIPWIIELKDVRHYSQIVVGGVFQVELNDPFLVAPDFQEIDDAVFAGFGARPGRIGMVIDDDGETRLRFRDPEPNEVVVVREGCEVLRWDATVGAWLPYRTLPQRALDGQFAFELFDSQGVYDFYAKLVGLVQSQLTYDTTRLRDFVDSLQVPDAFVALLADNFGLRVDTALPVDQRRELIRQFIRIQRAKGGDQSIRDALLTLGFRGYANNIWVIPGGGSFDYIEKPIGYDVEPAATYFPASQVSIHLNDLVGNPLQAIDDATRQTVASFLVENVLPAHVRIRLFVTDTPVADPEGIEVSDELTITTV